MLTRSLVVAVPAALLWGGAWQGQLHAQAGAALPSEVTPSMVQEGATIFLGAGSCFACHGPDGTGRVGPNLTDQVWLHSSGSYEEIVQQIKTGVPMKQSKSGVMMPPRGGSSISDPQVQAVAAYVWTLSHPPAK
jgi:mono/diheme cytochrome c family protein